jgi:hypothetical protein
LAIVDASRIDPDGFEFSILYKPFSGVGMESRKMQIFDRSFPFLVSTEIRFFIWPFRAETGVEKNDAPFRNRSVGRFIPLCRQR